MFLLDAHFAFLLLEQVPRYMPQHGKILRAIIFSDSTLILSECDVKNIMQRILYPPMGSDGFGKKGSVAFQAGNIIPALGALLSILFSLGNHNPYCLEAPPLRNHWEAASTGCKV